MKEKRPKNSQRWVEKIQRLLNSKIVDPKVGVPVRVEREGVKPLLKDDFRIVNEFVVVIRHEVVETEHEVFLPSDSTIPAGLMSYESDVTPSSTVFIYGYNIADKSLTNLASAEVEVKGRGYTPDFHEEGEDCIDAATDGKRLLRFRFKEPSTISVELEAFEWLVENLREGTGKTVVLYTNEAGHHFCGRLSGYLRDCGLIGKIENVQYGYMLCDFGCITLDNGNRLKLVRKVEAIKVEGDAAALLYPEDDGMLSIMGTCYKLKRKVCKKFLLPRKNA